MSVMTVDERDSFRTLYATHAQSVYATALAILKNADTANDVVHDVFLRAWQQAAQYDARRGSIGVWLRAIARNLSIDRLRSAQHVLSREGVVDEVCTPPGESLSQLLTCEQLDALRRGFHRLAPMHRRLIEMAYDQELSHAEIAMRLCQPLGTVKSRIRQALALLRTFAGEIEPEPTGAGASWLTPASDALTTVETDVSPGNVRLRQVPPLHVLVVDDDEETVKLVSAVLRKFQLRADARTSVRDGVKALEECWPDVLISDLNMPGEDGYSLLGRARAMGAERGQRLRAAAFTAWASEQERSRALLAGFDLYINKPVHPLALIAAIDTLSQ